MKTIIAAAIAITLALFSGAQMLGNQASTAIEGTFDQAMNITSP